MPNHNATPKRCILYYPTISIPSGRWIKQAILYWDEIGSIVPQRYDETELIPYTPVVQHLKREGLFRPFRPEAIINQGWTKIEEFEQEFRAIIESQQVEKLLHRPSLPSSQGKNLPLLSRIHIDKVSDNLFHYLEQRGLAQRESHSEQYSEWYCFENNTALLYMAILAKYLADEDIQSTIPGTNLSAYENLIFQTLKPDEGIACLRTSFQKALPIPQDDVPMQKIVEFKRRRHAELLHFRQEIDILQKSLRESQSQAEVKEIITSFKEKIELNVNDLEAIMSDARIATIPGSLKTIIKLDSPTLWTTIGVAAGQATKVADIPLEWSAVGIGILGAIEVTTYLIDKRNEQRATLRNSPFAYLYHAQREKVVAMAKTG